MPAAVHAMFYAAVLFEGSMPKPPFDGLACAGIALYAAGAATMVCAMRLLGRFWTVKLVLAPDHRLQMHPLFRLVRHPNYYLGILPELADLALAFHALGDTQAWAYPLRRPAHPADPAGRTGDAGAGSASTEALA